MATKKANTDRDPDSVWRTFLRSKPLLPKDSCYKIERQERSGTAGQARRLTLAGAERGGKFHLETANKDRDGAVLVAVQLLMARDWRDRLKAQLALAETQALRLELALMERPEELDELLAAAEAERVDEEVSHG